MCITTNKKKIDKNGIPWCNSRGFGKFVTHVCGHINTLAGCNEPSKNRLLASHKWMPPEKVKNEGRILIGIGLEILREKKIVDNVSNLVAFLVNDWVGLELGSKFRLDELNRQLVKHETSIEMIPLQSSRASVQQ